MNFWHAAILGLVEGLTEFLPVSSTGHLILASKMLGLPADEFLRTFEIAIQSGAMGAVLLLYGRRFWVDKKTFLRTVTAFLPAAILGFALYKTVKEFLGSPSLVLASFFIGGVVLIAFDFIFREDRVRVRSTADISPARAVWVGLCQCLALIPGVSRSAATIIGGLAAGLDRKTAVEFSFLLAVPTLLAATGLELFKTSGGFSPREWSLLAVGAAVSFVTAIAAIRFFLRFIQSHGFRVFGIYRIVAAMAGWFFLR